MNHSIISQIPFKVHKCSFKIIVRHEERHVKNRNRRRTDNVESIQKTDVDIVLADIIEWFEEAQKIHQDLSEKQKKKTEKDAAKAEDMRRKSLETIGEIMKLKSAESDEKQSRCRNTGSETLKFLQEKTESEIAIW